MKIPALSHIIFGMDTSGMTSMRQERGSRRPPEGGPGIWDSRPPSVAPKTCSKRSDIDFIFQLQYTHVPGGLDNGKFEDVCLDAELLENTYLAWNNGKPIEREQRDAEDHKWCEAKCKANPECGGWTFSKNNGWCALKRSDQIKKEKKENFISGIKNC